MNGSAAKAADPLSVFGDWPRVDGRHGFCKLRHGLIHWRCVKRQT
jgi:hypothetical protein